jgi:hydroxymethylglutaryl-CoA reductase (NADPH)
MSDPVISRDDFQSRVALVQRLLAHTSETCEAIRTDLTEDQVRGKIENFVGAVSIPLGLCGPIDISGQYAKGSFVVPMATLEGTLVASYSRGAKVMNESGGCETVVYGDAFLRSAQFTTRTLADSVALVEWCQKNEAEIRGLIEASSSHLSLTGVFYDCVSNTVNVTLSMETGDAMGSNMAAKATDVLAEYVRTHTHLAEDSIAPCPEDKKYIPARQKGKKVIARTVLKREPVAAITRASLEQLAAYIRSSKNLLAIHGGYSLNVHAANGMAALFQAMGQDMAYLAECSQVLLDCHFVGSDSLAVSVTLPTLIIGTVGGATGLPAFRTMLSLVDCHGPGKAKKLGEIMSAVILAGEISCGAAECTREFVRAHETMGKNRPPS